MGRLIDADKLMEDVRKNSESYFADDFAEQWVNRQQTVDAITVGWIEAKIKRLKDMDNGYPCLAADILYGILIDWRREQNGQTG